MQTVKRYTPGEEQAMPMLNTVLRGYTKDTQNAKGHTQGEIKGRFCVSMCIVKTGHNLLPKNVYL